LNGTTLPPLGQVLGIGVRGADSTARRTDRLALDNLMAPALLVQQGAGNVAEAVK
jgi:hypothetical protein